MLFQREARSFLKVRLRGVHASAWRACICRHVESSLCPMFHAVREPAWTLWHSTRRKWPFPSVS
eukprot:1321907-Pleurochrysis_carterae.AAC.3